MNLPETLEQRFQRIEMLKMHYTILTERENFREDCKDLQKETREVQELMKEAKECIVRWPALKKNYKNEVKLAQKQQLFMLKFMEILEDLPKKEEPKPTLTAPSVPAIVCTPAIETFRTPRSSIRRPMSSVRRSASAPRSSRRYDSSPFFTVRAISFDEFEYHVTAGVFARIPRYMSGRDNLDDLQNFLDSVISKCFIEKYTLMSQRRKDLPIRQWTLYDLFFEQEKEFPKRRFITQGDISRFLGKMMDKKVNSRIQMLKYIKVLQEVRKKTTIFYIWLPDSPSED